MILFRIKKSSQLEKSCQLFSYIERLVFLYVAIGGQVVDAQSGTPIEHFNIRIRRSGDDYQGSIPSSFGYKGVDFSSEEGRFYIDDLDSGTRLMLLVKVPGYRYFLRNFSVISD